MFPHDYIHHISLYLMFPFYSNHIFIISPCYLHYISIWSSSYSRFIPIIIHSFPGWLMVNPMSLLVYCPTRAVAVSPQRPRLAAAAAARALSATCVAFVAPGIGRGIERAWHRGWNSPENRTGLYEPSKSGGNHWIYRSSYHQLQFYGWITNENWLVLVNVWWVENGPAKIWWFSHIRMVFFLFFPIPINNNCCEPMQQQLVTKDLEPPGSLEQSFVNTFHFEWVCNIS